MCDACLTRHKAASALPASQAMLEAANLIDLLYEHPEAAAGGPLHIVTDDFNLTDGMLDYCASRIDAATSDPDLADVCRDILTRLRPMSEAQRAATIGLAHGYLEP